MSRVFKLSEILTGARNLISTRDAFHTGYFAANSGGRHVSAGNPDACRWCSFGAIEEIIFRINPEFPAVELFAAPKAALNEIARKRGFPNMPIMNDSVTHAEVLAVFDDAIREALTMEAKAA